MQAGFCLDDREFAFGCISLLLVAIDHGFQANLKLPLSEGHLILCEKEVFAGNGKELLVQEYLIIGLGDVKGYGLQCPRK